MIERDFDYAEAYRKMISAKEKHREIVQHNYVSSRFDVFFDSRSVQSPSGTDILLFSTNSMWSILNASYLKEVHKILGTYKRI